MNTDALVAAAHDLIRAKAITHFDEPIQLASGAMTKVFIDGKAGFAHAKDLAVASEAMWRLVVDAGIDCDVVGGPTLGADHLAVGIAMIADISWFFVRKEPKGRGTGKQIEGATLGPQSRVLVVEDVVSTGRSMLDALDVIAATGAQVVAVSTLLDRGDTASAELAIRSIPYVPLSRYTDFGLDPVAT